MGRPGPLLAQPLQARMGPARSARGRRACGGPGARAHERGGSGPDAASSEAWCLRQGMEAPPPCQNVRVRLNEARELSSAVFRCCICAQWNPFTPPSPATCLLHARYMPGTVRCRGRAEGKSPCELPFPKGGGRVESAPGDVGNVSSAFCPGFRLFLHRRQVLLLLLLLLPLSSRKQTQASREYLG